MAVNYTLVNFLWKCVSTLTFWSWILCNNNFIHYFFTYHSQFLEKAYPVYCFCNYLDVEITVNCPSQCLMFLFHWWGVTFLSWSNIKDLSHTLFYFVHILYICRTRSHRDIYLYILLCVRSLGYHYFHKVGYHCKITKRDIRYIYEGFHIKLIKNQYMRKH